MENSAETRGRINIKVSKEVHTAARVYGIQQGMTLSEVVATALKKFMEEAKAA